MHNLTHGNKFQMKEPEPVSQNENNSRTSKKLLTPRIEVGEVGLKAKRSIDLEMHGVKGPRNKDEIPHATWHMDKMKMCWEIEWVGVITKWNEPINKKEPSSIQLIRQNGKEIGHSSIDPLECTTRFFEKRSSLICCKGTMDDWNLHSDKSVDELHEVLEDSMGDLPLVAWTAKKGKKGKSKKLRKATANKARNVGMKLASKSIDRWGLYKKSQKLRHKQMKLTKLVEGAEGSTDKNKVGIDGLPPSTLQGGGTNNVTHLDDVETSGHQMWAMRPCKVNVFRVVVVRVI
ncbi:hypothetical protein QQP08_024952 [Theobroma cacao]|nr:hypothetical protein QQP08_024952 [Theobroma cacao]